MKEQIRNALKKVPIAYNLWHNFRLKINERNEKVKKTSYDKFALEVLNEVSQIVMTSGYKCVCMFGTLLGIVRDGQLLPWDDDIDFAFIPDENFPVEQFEKKLQAAGFWKYRTLVANGVLEEFSYKKKNVMVDFFIWPAKDNAIECVFIPLQMPGYQYENGTPAVYCAQKFTMLPIKETITTRVKGVDVCIPKNYEEIMEKAYGKNWRVPDPNFVTENKLCEKEYTITYYRKPLFKK